MISFGLQPAVYMVENMSHRSFFMVFVRLDKLFCDWMNEHTPHLTRDVIEFVVSPMCRPVDSFESCYEVIVRIHSNDETIISEATLLRIRYGA